MNSDISVIYSITEAYNASSSTTTPEYTFKTEYNAPANLYHFVFSIVLICILVIDIFIKLWRDKK